MKRKDMSHVILLTIFVVFAVTTLILLSRSCVTLQPTQIIEEPQIVHVAPLPSEPVEAPVMPTEEPPVIEVVEAPPVVVIEEEVPLSPAPVVEMVVEPIVEEPIVVEVQEPAVVEVLPPLVEESPQAIVEEAVVEEPPPVIEEEVVVEEPPPVIEEEAIIEEPVPPLPLIPPIPFLFEPMVISEEEYNIFWAEPFDVVDGDDDFWADFFVVGEGSTVAYDDGFYFLNLFVNDERVGDVEVEFDGEARLIKSEELSYYVKPHITVAAQQRIFGDKLAYISLEELVARGVEASYDASAFAVYLTFNLEDMPERMVSITTSSINRRQQYGMSGAITLKPAAFALASSLSLYGMVDYPQDFSLINNRMLSLSVSNRASIFGVGLNFYFTITPDISGKASSTKLFNFGSWNGFYDFVESSHRLSFGNVGSSLKSEPGATNIGFTLEKSYGYGTSTAKGNQFEHRITIVEPSTVVIEINGQEVFNRRFQPGTYRLRDFVFTQGANQILIRVVTDSGEVHTEYVDMGYDYRLLGKGDTLYSLGFSIPRVKDTVAKGAFSIPWLGGQYLSYYPETFTATYSQQVGLTDTFTLSVDLAFSPGLFSGTLNGVVATMVGTSQLQLSVGLDEALATPSLNASFGHRFAGKPGSPLANLSTNISHSIPALKSGDPYKSNSTLSLSYSGSITEKIRYTLSTNVGYDTSDSYPSWSTSFATGFSPFKGFSISGSITANGAASNPLKPVVSAQISGSYSFSSKLNANTSTSIQNIGNPNVKTSATSSMGVSWRPSSNDSVNFSLSGLRFNDLKNNTISGYWSHSGNLSSFSLRQQLSGTTGMMTTTFTANTSLAFAGGAFGVGRAVNDSFLLVKPKGELRRSDISVARSLDSAPSYLSRPLGSALYNSISPNVKNSVVVFSSGATDYSTGHSFVFEVTPRSRQSFVAKLVVEPSFTVSGVLLHADRSPYIQYSSPVYQVTQNEQGDKELVRDDSLYLFTDQDGRYILSEVKSGTYLFDLQVEDLWYAVEFTVPKVDGQKVGLDRVLLLEEFWVSDPQMADRIVVHDALSGAVVEEEEDIFGTVLATGYDAEVSLDIVDRITEEKFWTIIFPPFDESAFNFEQFDDGFVTADDFAFDAALFDALVGSEEDASPSTQVVTAAP